MATLNTLHAPTHTVPAAVSPLVRYRRALEIYAWVVLAFMVLVILEGAIVRATSSGGGCGNHWPLCNGEVLPHHPRVATVIEFTHRSMTGVLSTMVFALVAAVYWATRGGAAAGRTGRRHALWVLGLLVVEALLGALLVKGGYVERNTSVARVIVQAVHFTSTLSLVAALTLTAAWLRRPFARDRRHAHPPSTHRARLFAAAAVVFTVVSGAAGSVAALADTLFPSASLRTALHADFAENAPLLVRMRWVHPAASMLAVAAALLLAWSLRQTSAARWLVALVAMQLLLGVLDVVMLAPVWLQVLHLLGADVFWIALVLIAGHLYRPTPSLAKA